MLPRKPSIRDHEVMNELRNYTGVSKIRAFDDKEQLIIVWFNEYEKKNQYCLLQLT